MQYSFKILFEMCQSEKCSVKICHYNVLSKHFFSQLYEKKKLTVIQIIILFISSDTDILLNCTCFCMTCYKVLYLFSVLLWVFWCNKSQSSLSNLKWLISVLIVNFITKYCLHQSDCNELWLWYYNFYS